MPAYGYAGFKERTNLNLKRIISLVLIPLIVTVLIALNSVSDILFYDTF